MIWTVIFTAKAERDLEKIPDDIAKRIILKLEEIAQDDPYQKLDKMTNSPYYKFRVGVYRGIVNIVNDKMILQLVKAKHRSKAYKK
jgi:mRNA interferase RelE/StbE